MISKSPPGRALNCDVSQLASTHLIQCETEEAYPNPRDGIQPIPPLLQTSPNFVAQSMDQWRDLDFSGPKVDRHPGLERCNHPRQRYASHPALTSSSPVDAMRLQSESPGAVYHAEYCFPYTICPWPAFVSCLKGGLVERWNGSLQEHPVVFSMEIPKVSQLTIMSFKACFVVRYTTMQWRIQAVVTDWQIRQRDPSAPGALHQRVNRTNRQGAGKVRSALIESRYQ
ncbi:hypothetical protein LA080_010380 [Diaporthe eres]|nr:hypothetical protein LA080_010380 [Diaporthe eres]